MRETYMEDLQEIRGMMARSSRFMSLSGMSGVIAGLAALIGAWLVWREIQFYGVTDYSQGYYEAFVLDGKLNTSLLWFCAITAVGVLAVSLIAGTVLTLRKAKKDNAQVLSRPALLLFQSLFIPLVTGGIVSLGLVYHGYTSLIAPVMLIFYGIGLESASKYTLRDIHFLGISEVILGLVSLFFLNHGLLFWSIGFGALHIIYGAMMYFKYERK